MFRNSLWLIASVLFSATAMRADGLPASTVADAAMRGDSGAVRALIQSGADVNLAEGDGMTALHWAAERGDAELAALLLKSGASVTAETRIGRHTPLHVAARHGNSAIVRALVNAHAAVNALTTTGAAPLHFAAASGDSESIAALLDHGAVIDIREPQWSQTPLMFAAAGGRTAAVKLLLARGANPSLMAKVIDISARNRSDGAESRTRNARVAEIQRQAAAKAGTAAKPVQSGRGRGNDDGNEPEPLGYADLVGAQGGLTALILAAREGHAETAFALLDAGANINQVSAADRTSPLLIASINGHFDLASQLLARGADVRLASDAGATPLYGVLNMQWAPKARHPQPAKYMQQQTGYLELAEAMLKAGADPNARLRKSLGTPPTTATC
jgi:ankyrin repeat protein